LAGRHLQILAVRENSAQALAPPEEVPPGAKEEEELQVFGLTASTAEAHD
jgi:hypothetical protein